MRRIKDREVTGFRLVLGYLGTFTVLGGIITAVPLIMILFYPQEIDAWAPFGLVSLADIIIGFTLYFAFVFKRRRMRFMRNEESMLLILSWIMVIVSGAAPFFIFGLMGKIDMNASMAIFESTSGYSTTGLTVFQEYIDVEGAFCPHVLTFHRAWMNFIGGMGLVLLIASVLGSGGGVSLYAAEGHSDKLLPNIAKSAKLIFGIYLFYTITGFFLLMFVGMPWFDALTHSMSALSGGGFSPRELNIAAFRLLDGQLLDGAFQSVNSLGIEIVMEVLVCLSAISFVLHTFLLRGRFLRFLKDSEIRFGILSITGLLTIAFFGTLTATAAGRDTYFSGGWEAFRVNVFYVINAFACSGFASTADLPQFTFHIAAGAHAMYAGHAFTVVLVLLMLVGGGAGSTAGGIKQFRVVIALKKLYYSVRYRFSSIHQHYPTVVYRFGDNKELDDETVHESHNYILIFIGLFLALTFGLMFCAEYDFTAAAFDSASAVTNTGLSMRIGYEYVKAHQASGFAALWGMSFGMLLGRLEILPAAYAIRNVSQEIAYHHTLVQRAKREAALFETPEGE